MSLRTFTSPSGRAWTVEVVELPSYPGSPKVHALRFVSGQVVFELEQWPTDWDALPDAELVELEGAGHQSPLERPDTVSRLLRRRTRDLLAA